MRLPDQIRSAACVAWVGVLGIGQYFAREAHRESGSGVIRVSAAEWTLPAVLGGQEPPTRPRTGEAHTGRKGLAKSLTPGFACCSSSSVFLLAGAKPIRGEVAASMAPLMGSTQGVRLAPAEWLSRSLRSEARRGSFRPYVVTAYSHGCVLPKFGPEPPPQRMASGEWPVAGLHVAADPSLAFGTVLEVVYRGLPSRLIVGDRGRAIRGLRLDLFLADCRAARDWGRRTAYVREIGASND